MNKLPTFKGYTVDSRLKEFRKLVYWKSFEIVPFNTPKGRNLLNEYEDSKEKEELWQEKN